eukprot:jgi/Astpho2/9709/Aster-x0867
MLAAPLSLWLYKKYGEDIDHPTMRAAFALVVTAAAALIFYIHRQITQKHDQAVVEHEVKKPGQDPVTKSTPTWEYDQTELKKLLSKMGLPVLIVVGLHAYKGYLQPLAMQIVMLPLNLFESQLFKVHVLGQAPQGALARPWKEDNPFAAFTEGAAKAKEVTADASKQGAGPTQASAAGSNGTKETIKKTS